MDQSYLNYRHAIGHIESSNNYSEIGPPTRSGDRAYGRYQVMGNNIPEWTEKYYGQRLTPDQFLKNQDAQDKVFDAKFGADVAKYGNPQDAASVWFSGRPMVQAGNANDLYTDVPTYVARFNKALASAPAGDAQTASSAPVPSSSPGANPGQPQAQGLMAQLQNAIPGMNAIFPNQPPSPAPAADNGAASLFALMKAEQAQGAQPQQIQFAQAQPRPVSLAALQAQLGQMNRPILTSQG